MATEQMVFGKSSWEPDELACLAEVLMSCKALKKLNLLGNKLASKPHFLGDRGEGDNID